MHRIRLLLATGAVVAGLLATPAGASTSSQLIGVSGHWYNAGPCLFTGMVPRPRHPTHVDATCDGSSVWTGTWRGVTEFAATFHGNVVTSDYDGTLAELFTGAGDHRYGSLLFHESFHLADGHIRIVTAIVGSSGGFRGSTGSVVFNGTITPATNGFGRYQGWWRLPQR